jgi:PAS domain S-box-containing protein
MGESLLKQMRNRAVELAAIAEISRQITTILDLDRVLWTVCDLIKSEFSFYHVHIYLFDDASQTLRLVAGQGEIGRALVNAGLKIALDTKISVVAEAARSRQVINIPEVRESDQFLPNPLLPYSCSELAIPLLAGDRLLGVLNIEDDTPGRFAESDVNLQTTLAAQVAIAVDNARLFSDSARRLAIIESVTDTVAMSDLSTPELKVIYVNPAGAALLGYASPQDVLRRPVRDFYPPEVRAQMRGEVLPAVLEQGLWRGENVIQRQDGSVIPVEQTVFVIHDEQGNPRDLATIITDLSERQHTERALRRVNRAYRALSDCNQAMANASDENELLRDICRIVVDAGGYRMAWVGLADQPIVETLAVAAFAGHEEGYLERALGSTCAVAGPTQTAYQTGLPCVVWNIATDPLFAPWRALALERGYRSMVSLPLKQADQIIGNLNVYATEPHAFDMGEVGLLNELAGDLVYGLEAIKLRRERETAEAEMRRLNSFLQKRTQELMALYDIGRTLNELFDVRKIYQVIYDEVVVNLFGANCLFVARYDETTQLITCEYLALDGETPDPASLPAVPLGEGPNSRAIITRQPQIVDFSDFGTGKPGTGNQKLVGDERRPLSGLYVPLISVNQVIGVLNIQHYAANAFQETDLPLVITFANLAATVIQNARSFAGEHEQRVLAEALSETATTITRTLDSQVVIENILDRLGYVVQHSAANLMLIEGDYVQVMGYRGYAERGLEDWVKNLRAPYAQVSGMRRMYETAQPFVVADIDRDYPDWALATEARWVKSYAGAPIRLGDRVIGFLNIYSDQPGFFARMSLARLQSFADLAAIAIRNAQLFAAEHGQRALAEALSSIAAALNQQLDPDVVMDRILSNLRQVVPYDAASMMLIDRDIAYVVRHSGFEERGMAEAVENLRLSLNTTHWMQRGEGRAKPHRIENVQQFPEWKLLPGGEWMRGYLSAPVQYGDQLLGFLNLDSAIPGFFTDEHALRLQAFADQAAIAIQNAQLFAAEREQRMFNETLRNIAVTINQTLDLDTVLSDIFLYIRRVVPHDAANVMLIEGGMARVVRESGYAERGLGEWVRQVRFVIQDNAIMRQMIESVQPVIVSDTTHDPGWQHFPETGWIRSAITVPLRQDNHVIGFMNVYSTAPNFFEPAHVDRLEAFAEQVTSAIRNAQLFTGIQRHTTEMTRRADELALINRVAVRLAQTLDPREIYDIATTELQIILQVQAVSLVLFEDNRLGLLMSDTHPTVPADGSQVRMPLGYSKTMDEFFSTRQTIVSDHVLNDDRFNRMKPLWQARGTQSMMMIPLLAGDDLMGFISVEAREQRSFTPAEREICETITSQVSIAIAKAQLYDSERKQRMLAETLSQTAAAINQSLDPAEVLNLILQNANRIAAHDAANIMLIDGNDAHVVVEKGYDRYGVGDWVRTLHFKVSEVPLWNRMFETGRPFAIADTRQDSRWTSLGLPQEEWIRSTVKAPIRVEGRIIGLLNLDSARPAAFDAHDAERLQSLAEQAAVALRNAQFFAEIQRSAEQLSQLVAERTAELEQQRVQLQIILDSISEGVMYDEKLHIRFINRALTRLTGYQPGELTGYLDTLRGSKMDDAQLALITRRVFESVERLGIWQGEMRLRRKDGSEFDASLTATPVRDPGGAVIGAVTVIRDISQEKALRDQKDRFIASASHELRTPLTNLKTRLYLLKRQPEKAEQHLNVLNHVTNSMSELVENLLDVSRFERGVIALHPRQVELQTLVNEVVAIQLAEAERKQVSLITDLHPAPLLCLVDPPRISQVITNLLTNAINYTPTGGQIHIELSADHPDAPEQAVLRVRDTGIGIPPHLIERVFDPFFRGREEIAVGTGLGLTIAREIITLHGGQISVESELDRGSVFTVRLNLIKSGG